MMHLHHKDALTPACPNRRAAIGRHYPLSVSPCLRHCYCVTIDIQPWSAASIPRRGPALACGTAVAFTLELNRYADVRDLGAR
jgi:hypothetical protein